MGRTSRKDVTITVQTDAAPIAPPRQRPPRPGQEGPEGRRGPKRPRRADDGGGEEASSSAAPKNKSNWPPYSEKKRRAAAAHGARRSKSAMDYVSAVPRVKSWHKLEREWKLEHMQQRVDEIQPEVLLRHSCCSTANSTVCLTVKNVKNKDFKGLGIVGVIKVQQFSCNTCKEVVAVQPEDVGCFPKGPTQMNTWLDQAMLEAVKFAALGGGGFSCSGKSCLCYAQLLCS